MVTFMRTKFYLLTITKKIEIINVSIILIDTLIIIMILSILDLPNEIILLILEKLRIYNCYEDECLIYDAYGLYASCKHFSWLKNYRFGFLFETECDVIYSTVDINGRQDGPEYRFNTYDDNPSGFIFYKSGKIVGNYCYIDMMASNLLVFVINGCKYNLFGTDGNDCSELYQIELAKIYNILYNIDSAVFKFIHTNKFKHREACIITHQNCIDNKFLYICENKIKINIDPRFVMRYNKEGKYVYK